jgi:TrmH family RNA methyltransferase
MISKREVKYIQSLCQKKQRLADRLFIVEGEKAVDELLLSQWEVKQIYATAFWKATHQQVSVPVNEATMEQIWLAIEDACDTLEIKSKED